MNNTVSLLFESWGWERRFCSTNIWPFRVLTRGGGGGTAIYGLYRDVSL